MKEYSKAYKAYDIRSIWDEPIDSTFVYALGKGVGAHLLETRGSDATFVFGADVREANNELIYRFLKGLEEGGCTNYIGIGIPVDAVDGEQQQLRGVASTMMLYYCTKHTFDMGVIFTASHNGPEYVGMKVVNNQALLVESAVLASLVETYTPITEEIDEQDFHRIWNKALGEGNVLAGHIDEKLGSLSAILANRFQSLEKKYTVVVDFSNGAAVGYERVFLEEIIGASGHTIIMLNEKADSEFSAHLSDTTDPHDYQQLIAKVKEVGADFGIMFDGDADRLGCVDEQGNMIGGDIVAGMIAINMLKRGGEKKKVIHDVFFTKAVLEKIVELGGEPIKSRVGHRFVKELFKSHNALFAGELSAHLFFEEVGGFECPLLALYYLMDEYSLYDSVSQAVLPYMKYHKPPLKKYAMTSRDDIDPLLENIITYYTAQGYTIDRTDGVGVYGTDFRFVVRASNTEPILRMGMETDALEIYTYRTKELEYIIKTPISTGLVDKVQAYMQTLTE